MPVLPSTICLNGSDINGAAGDESEPAESQRLRRQPVGGEVWGGRSQGGGGDHVCRADGGSPAVGS